DDSIQKVTAVSIRLDTFAGRHPDLAKDETFTKLQAIIRRTIESLRHLMFELRPDVLDSDGLVPALRQHVEQESKLDDSPEYHLHNGLHGEPSQETRIVLYRIAQEALS